MADPWQKRPETDQGPTAPATDPAYPPQNVNTAPYPVASGTTPYPQSEAVAPGTTPYPQSGEVAPGTAPYPHQPYPPQDPGVTGPALEQPPPYPGPPLTGYQQPYPPQPGYQQPYPPQPGFQQPYPQLAGGDPTKTNLPPPQQPNVVVYNNTSAVQQPGHNVIVRTVQDCGPQPENYLIMSILSIFCCLIFGIIATIFSSRVGSLWAQGRHAEARSSAAFARGFAIAAIVFGIVILILNIILRMS